MVVKQSAGDGVGKLNLKVFGRCQIFKSGQQQVTAVGEIYCSVVNRNSFAGRSFIRHLYS